MSVRIINGPTSGPVTFGSYTTITVTDAGRITATGTGVEASGTLISDGYISATGIGVYVYAGQSVTNQSAGKMLGGAGAGGIGVSLASSAMFSNDGLVKAHIGVVLGASDTVTNEAAGTIEGAITGVVGGGTITNAGTISGGSDTGVAAELTDGASNLLVVDPDAAFVGTVVGGGAGSTLEFASGASHGTFSGLGAQYADFAQVSIGAGAFWTASGANNLAAGQALTNAGTMVATDSGIDQTGGTFFNDGLFAAGSQNAIGVFSGGVLTNAVGGTIAGGANIAAIVGTGGAMSNAGLISGGNYGGAYVNGGGVVTNLAGGTISGTSVGLFDAEGTLINAGTVAAAQTTDFAVTAKAGTVSLVVVDPGAAFVGTVAGGGADSTLEFASGASHGTFSGLGSHYVDFTQVTIGAGAFWTASGTNSLAAGQTLTDSYSLFSTGQFTNAGTMVAAAYGIDQSGGEFVNDGLITAGLRDAIEVFNGGLLTNALGGTIAGGANNGAFVGTGGTLSNAGLITGGNVVGAYVSGGVITNALGGTIAGGGKIGAAAGAGGTLSNAGLITGAGSSGAGYIAGGGMVTNLAGGTISGTSVGLVDAEGTLINAGTIAAAQATDFAVVARASSNSFVVVDPGAAFVGTVAGGGAGSTLEFATGATHGTLSGLGSHYADFAQVSIDSNAHWTATSVNTLAAGQTLTDSGFLYTAGSFVNDGVVNTNGEFLVAGGMFLNNANVTATDGLAFVTGGAVLTNAASGLIGGGTNHSVMVDASTVINSGSIGGGSSGGVDAYLGSVTNLAGATIAGSNVGISMYGGTLVNAGLIAAANSSDIAVNGTDNANFRMVVDPGAEFVGRVDGYNTIGATHVSALEFASGASGGTFTGLGSQYVNFAVVSVDAGAQWTANGANTLAAEATLTDAGALTFAAAPVGAGLVTLAGHGITLASDGGASIGPSIGGLNGNTIELVGTVEHFASLSGHELALDGGTTLTFAGSYSAGDVDVTNDGANTFIMACFASGTRLATARGAVAVEALGVGELVVTASGRLASVRWIGHRRVDLRRHARPFDVMPVRVCAGAFVERLPVRDLVLSPDHAVWVDGYLVPVRYLINGRSILQERRDSVTYWHVELDRHDLVLAEGMACESYLDTGNRGAFENGGDPVTLHPAFGREHALSVWEAASCAPILFDPREPALRARHTRLLARAERLARAA